MRYQVEKSERSKFLKYLFELLFCSNDTSRNELL